MDAADDRGCIDARSERMMGVGVSSHERAKSPETEAEGGDEMRNTRVAIGIGALVLAGMLGGTLVGSALGTTGTGAASPADPAAVPRSEYCDLFLDRFSQELGVERSAVLAAAKTAAGAAVDAAVARGDLTNEHGDRIKERIASADRLPCPSASHRFGHGRGFGHGRHHAGGFDSIPGKGLLHGLGGAAATALGVDREGLVDRMLRGESLREIASAQKVDYESVRTAVLDRARERLGRAVEKGRLHQEGADRLIAGIDQWLADGGDLPLDLEVEGERRSNASTSAPGVAAPTP